jgi:hypothetical protein
MPWLDVSDIVVDPDLADRFNVIQRQESVDANTGRSSTTQVLHEGIVGVVTMENPADLMRRDDSDSAPRLIFVASTFRFRNAGIENGQQYKGDVIVWPPPGQLGSTQYTVIKVYPYSRYGRGITECVAQSMNATDEVL